MLCHNLLHEVFVPQHEVPMETPFFCAHFTMPELFSKLSDARYDKTKAEERH